MKEKISNNKQRKVGIALQYLQMFLSLLIQFFYIPIMLKLLSQAEYAIYNTALSSISFLSLLTLGVGSSYIKFKSLAKTGKTTYTVSDLNGFYLLFFSICSLVALSIGITLSFNVSIFFNESFATEEVELFRIIFLIMVVNIAISFPCSLFPSFIMSEEKHIFQKSVNMISTVFLPLCNIGILFLGHGSLGMAIATLGINIVVHIFNILYSFIKLKMKFTLKGFSKSLILEIGVFSLFIAINQVVNQINWQADKILLTKLTNAASVAIYSVAAQICAFFRTFSTPVSNAYVPKINRIISENKENSIDELNKMLNSVGIFEFIVLFFIFSGFVIFGKYFIGLWAGAEYQESYYISLILMAPLVITLSEGICFEVLIAKNKHKIGSLVYLLASLINIGITIVLIKWIGVIGAPIGTAISLVITDGIIMNIFYAKVLHLDILRFFKEIFKTIKFLFAPIIVGVCIILFLNNFSIVSFILLIIGYTFVYWTSYFVLYLSKDERIRYMSIIKNRIQKK